MRNPKQEIFGIQALLSTHRINQSNSIQMIYLGCSNDLSFNLS